jgi:hypothetical protein
MRPENRYGTEVVPMSAVSRANAWALLWITIGLVIGECAGAATSEMVRLWDVSISL